MERYLEQLIADMRQSRTKVLPPNTDFWESVDINNENEVEDIAYIESAMTKGSPISEIVGIDTKALPIEEVLTNDQKALLASELTALLNHYNLYPDFPDGYPEDKKYAHFLMMWDDEYSPASFGETHIELCDFDLDACPFEGYCTICIEMKEESLRGPQIKEGDDFFDVLPENLLPF